MACGESVRGARDDAPQVASPSASAVRATRHTRHHDAGKNIHPSRSHRWRSRRALIANGQLLARRGLVLTFFAVAFGLLFLTSAAMMFGQLATQPNAKNRTLIIFFALLNGIAGIVCFMLERDWSHGLTASGKVPLYALFRLVLGLLGQLLIARFNRAVRMLYREPAARPCRMADACCCDHLHIHGRHVRRCVWNPRY